MDPVPQPPRRRGFLGFLTGCATGAANDNLFRQIVEVALVAEAGRRFLDPAEAKATGLLWVIIAGLAFIVPFVLLAPLAGSLGDRTPKHLLIRAVRICEVPLCILGAVGLFHGEVWMLMGALMLLAVQASFFAPTKLAVVPELVDGGRLPKANAHLQAATVLAILAGTGLAFVADPKAIDATPFAALGPAGAVAALSLTLCAVGIVGAWRIPALPAQDPHAPLKPFDYVGQLRALFRGTGLIMPAISVAGFWSLGSAAQLMIIAAAEHGYHLGQAGTAVLNLMLAFGIVIGALLAPRLMVRAFPAGLPALGALVAGLFLVWAGIEAARADAAPAAGAWWTWEALGFGLPLFGAGICCGLWEVPLVVLLQERADPKARNQVMAASGVLASLGMIGAMVLCYVLTQPLRLEAAHVLVVLGGIVVAAAAGFLVHYRSHAIAWVVATALRLAYRVRLVGGEHVPAEGGCVIACNHLSYADGAILATCLPRRGRFLVYRRYVDMPIVGAFMRAAGVIPVAAEDARRALIASIDAATAAATAGEAVVIFPEGKLTRGGQTDAFRGGVERIASRAGVPIVPAHLAGLWRTATSRAVDRRWPRPLRGVTLRIGSPLPSSASAAEIRDRVMQLSFEEANERAERDRRTLGASFLRRARRHPTLIAVQDAGGTLTYLQLASLARSLPSQLDLADDERRVGVLLPPGRGGAIANLALAIAGRTAVNINHTAGPAQLTRMLELAGVKTVISAKAYRKRIGDPQLPGRVLDLEDLLPRLGKPRLMLAAAKTFLTPARLADRSRPDDTAIIIFSSGSTGDPKGVELTHRQVLANCDAVAFALDLHAGRDVILSPLPLFHSFGLIPGFWLGMALGLRVAGQPDPTDAKALGDLAQASGATFMLATPTFARSYLRRIQPEQLTTLRFAVAGAERCPLELKQSFKERFGADLLEGYGCTELAPVVGINLPEVKRDGVVEVRAREGTIGRPLPGMQVLTIDPETHAILPVGAEGLLVVRSPSRMKGYLGRDDLTQKAFVHGGYNTGDIGKVDADGFVSITGRQARFAKIGGEMVPLDNVEAALQSAVGEAGEIAVAAVPDPARGERLIVLHTTAIEVEAVLRALDAHPPLWRPKPKDFMRVEAIPKLGTGKRDLAGLKKLAAEKAAG
ncbi:MAG TPA: MFS transporter [Planctomycetota bacterium]|nr:MFS transporter [Planctomycetota bacterium]